MSVGEGYWLDMVVIKVCIVELDKRDCFGLVLCDGMWSYCCVCTFVEGTIWLDAQAYIHLFLEFYMATWLGWVDWRIVDYCTEMVLSLI